jgi:hypothetical protein
MGVPFHGQRKIPSTKEAKKPKRPKRAVETFALKSWPVCAFNDKDVCQPCLMMANEVLLVKVGQHFKCPNCNFTCDCFVAA